LIQEIAVRSPLAIAGVMLFAMTSTEAASIARYLARDMTCGELERAVKGEGQIVLMRPSKMVPRLMVYNRYVGNGNMCLYGEVAKGAKMTTSDGGSCNMMICEIQSQKAGGVKKGPDDMAPATIP